MVISGIRTAAASSAQRPPLRAAGAGLGRAFEILGQGEFEILLGLREFLVRQTAGLFFLDQFGEAFARDLDIERSVASRTGGVPSQQGRRE